MDFKLRFHRFKSSILLLLASMHFFHLGILYGYSLWEILLYPMRLIYHQLNNCFTKRPIMQDFSEPGSSLGISDKNLCTNAQAAIYR